jgi:diguanylate cyclase (GGDEF)-like protein
LILRVFNKDRDSLHPTFFYSSIIACIVTAMLSSLFFDFDINAPLSSYDLAWFSSIAGFFIGNLTGAVFMIPIFMLFVYIKTTDSEQLKLDLRAELLSLSRMTGLLFLLATAFVIASLVTVTSGFSSYQHFVIIPMIWASVKWGLCTGLTYVFVGHLFVFLLCMAYDQHEYMVMEGQTLFSIAVISSLLIGLAHKEKNVLYVQSMYDELTHLPNMRLLKDISHSMMARANRNDMSGAFLFVDIDGFKAINDRFGHQAGDELLQKIANRLKNCLRESDIVARVGGDEFVIHLGDLKSADGAETVALNVIDNVSRPFYDSTITARVGASIGIALYPQHGTTMKTVMSKADKAMYAAKRSGKNVYRLYAEPS